ncbi:hypothetical protein llg_39520 [Luteolibacter sp. LG18]|nr:hypothetical protein llg_39520 [Luteolibacter sp. LG18]
MSSWNLKNLTAVGRRLNPEVAVARAQLESAKAAIATAAERPNPGVTLSPQFTAPFKWMLGTYGIDFDIPIETAGKRRTRIDLAREQAASAGFHVAEVSWQMRGKLRKALLELSVAGRREAMTQRAIDSQAQVIEMMNQRVAAGEASRPDFVQSRLLLTQLKMQQADAVRQKGEAQAAVAEAVGLSARAMDGAVWSLSEFEKVPEVGDIEAARHQALQHRSDVLAALADYAASEAALRGEVAKQYPDIHLGPGYQWDAGTHKWSLGSTFNLPVFNQNQGSIGEAEAKRWEAAVKFTAVQAAASAEVDKALASWRGARAKYSTAGELVASQEKQVQSAEALAQGGETDRLAVASASLEQATTDLARLDAQAELQAALGSLEDALQTPLSR